MGAATASLQRAVVAPESNDAAGQVVAAANAQCGAAKLAAIVRSFTVSDLTLDLLLKK